MPFRDKRKNQILSFRFPFFIRVSPWIPGFKFFDQPIFSLCGPPGAHPYRVPCIVPLFLLAICPQSSAVAWLGFAHHGCRDFAGKLCCGWLAGWYQPGRRIPSFMFNWSCGLWRLTLKLWKLIFRQLCLILEHWRAIMEQKKLSWTCEFTEGPPGAAEALSWVILKL